MEHPPAQGAPGDSLLRSVTRWELTAITVNAVIGAGIFGLPSRVYSLAGVYSLAAFLLCALFAALVALCFAELSSRFSGTGGPYLYIRTCFGSLAGFEVGWFMWLARVTSFAANSNLMAAYLGQLWPPASTGAGRFLFLTAFTITVFAVNLTGIRNTATANHLFTAGKLIPLAIFIVAGLFAADWSRLTPGPLPSQESFLGSILLLVYAFTGFEMAAVPAGELRHPRRDLPFALLTALAVTAGFYILIQAVCIGTLPGLATSDRPLSDAAQTFLGLPGARMIAVGVLISISGNLNITMLAASRLLFAMGEGGALPAGLARIDPRFRTPSLAIVWTAVSMLALALPGSFASAAALSAVARLIVFLSTALAVIQMRRVPGAPPAQFQLHGGSLIAVLCAATCILLLGNVRRMDALSASAAALSGLALYFFSALRRSPAR